MISSRTMNNVKQGQVILYKVKSNELYYLFIYFYSYEIKKNYKDELRLHFYICVCVPNILEYNHVNN